MPSAEKAWNPLALKSESESVSCSVVRCFATHGLLPPPPPALLSTGFFRQESWSGLPCLSPGDLPDPGIESGSPALQADSLPSEPPEKSCISTEPLNCQGLPSPSFFDHFFLLSETYLQGALISFSGKWNLGAMNCALDILIASEVWLFPGFSVDRIRKYVYNNVYMN